MDANVLQGAFVAIVTPFDQGQVDHHALRSLIDHLISQGIGGIVACGTTGEVATLNAAERVAVAKTTVEQCQGRVPAIAGVSTNDTRAAIAEAKHYAEIGADGLLVVTPYYNKPNQEGLYQHFKAVAEAAPLPQILYNVPSRTACRIDANTLQRLADIPNIVATKDATNDMVFLTDTIAACNSSFRLLSGDDFTFLPFLAVGGHGCISVVANIAPKLVIDIHRAVQEGQWDTARQLHHRLLKLAKLMFSDSNPIPVKAALALQGHIKNELRLPLVPMTPEALEKLRSALTSQGVL